MENIRLFIRVFKSKIRGLVRFLKSSRKDESFEGSMTGSVVWWFSEGNIWIYDDCLSIGFGESCHWI